MTRRGSRCAGTAVLVLVALALSGATAQATTWAPYQPRRDADPAGRYYVVVRPHRWDGDRTSYVIAERGPGQPPVESMVEFVGLSFEIPGYRHREVTRKPVATVREGDVVHGRGWLSHAPLDVLVSGEGLGFAALDQHGWVDSRRIMVTLVSPGGRIRHELMLDDLFTDREILSFPMGGPTTRWRRGGWFDDREKQVVIVSSNGPVRVIDFESGAVRDAETKDLLGGLHHPSAEARELALDLVAERLLAGSTPAALALLEDCAEPTAVRLRAAVALTALGRPSGRELLVECSRPGNETVDERDRNYAVRHLPDVLGREAIPHLVLAATVEASAAILAFTALGDAGVPVLIERVARHGDWWAAEALGRVGSRRALPTLLRILARREWYPAWHEVSEEQLRRYRLLHDPLETLARAALDAAVAIGGREIEPDLIALRERGTVIDREIDEVLEQWAED